MNIFKVNRKFNLGDLIISLLITVGGGFIVGLFIKPYVPIYKTLNKLFFFPTWVCVSDSLDYFIYINGNSIL